MQQSVSTKTGAIGLSSIAVYWVVFASFLDNHALLPLVAPYAKSLGASLEEVGLIAGAYSAVNLVGNLGAGIWIDRIGRKTPMVVGLLVAAAALGLYPLARDPTQLLILRMLHGMGPALASPASLALIGDNARQGQRAKAMAFYGAAIGLTVLIGPPLAGLVRDRLGYAYVFLTLASLVLVTALAAFLFVTESLTTLSARRSAVLGLMRNRRLSVSYTSAFCLMFSLGTLIVFLPLMGQELHLSSAQTGMLFASFALAAILVQLLPAGRISDRWGRRKPIVLGLGVMGAALALLPMLGDAIGLGVLMFLYGIGFGILFPAMTALISDELPMDARGVGSGVFTAVYSLGVAAGTLSAGALAMLQRTLLIHPFQSDALVMVAGIAWAVVALSHSDTPQGARGSTTQVD